MAASTNNMSLLLNQQDSNGVNVINRSVGAVVWGGVAGEFNIRTLAADTSIHALEMPVAVVLNVYFKNTHATALILLTGTVQGGASLVMARLPPGGVFVYWAPATTATVGYTAISYTSDTASATCEFFLGG